jgi:hypothetical protein
LVTSVAVVGCAGTGVDEELGESDDALTFDPPPAYAEGKLLSDLTPEIVSRLRAIHRGAPGKDDVFIKIGDSITVSESFLRCFASPPVAPLEAPLEETRTFFTADSWLRPTLAARVGGHTNEPLAGKPSPVDREVAEMNPAFAVVMLGTNDVFKGTEPSYELHLKALVDDLIARKIIPVLSTIPPLRATRRNPIIVKMNEIVRKVAAEANIPLMDFHLAVRDLPHFGISTDGIHPFEAKTGACDFRAPAMNAGYNQRNLLALRALDGVRRAVIP